MSKTDLKALTEREAGELLAALGQPAYRAGQLIEWIYGRGARDIDDITVFSKALRAQLNEIAYIGNLKCIDRRVSEDGTEKYLFGLQDGLTIESVLIPDEERLTLCISSQSGCAMGCKFCLTGRGGFKRNLMPHEIVDQVIAASGMIAPRKLTNIVLMGMGEPLKNLDNVAEALRRITGLLGFSPRRITLSTSGLAKELLMLPKVAPNVNIAISLNAATDEVRDRIMPVNRKYPIRELLSACKRYPLGRPITFEYVMLRGVNDSKEDARILSGLLKGILSKVNLIPFNEFPGSGFQRPEDSAVLAFQSILVSRGHTVLIRKSKGTDILAACGQLGAQHEG